MTWTIANDNTTDRMVVYPVFNPESKKEANHAKRMNNFYRDVLDAIIKSSAEKGYKCYIDIKAEKDDMGICVSLLFRARQRGKTLKEFSHRAIWKKGVIISQEK